MESIEKVRKILLDKVYDSDSPREVLRSKELRGLYGLIKTLPVEERSSFGQKINEIKQEIEKAILEREEVLNTVSLPPIDVTAPMDINSPRPELLSSDRGTIHPLSREIDDQFHMFESLNFPKGHPARDDYDTFMTEETDANGDRLIAPAHTSTMQNRVLAKYRDNLAKGEAIAAIVPDRVFRNEDLDARHEHTFYQVEGVYVAKGVNVGNLIATLQEFLQEYYGKKLDVRVNP